MLNALPDTRTPDETSEVFLASKDNKFDDNNECKEDADTEEKQSIHETITLDEQGPSLVILQKSEASGSVEICKITSTVETVEADKLESTRSDACLYRTRWFRLLAECIAELFGTAILVLFGCSGIAQYTLSRGVLSSFLSVNFAFGFGAMIAVYVAGPVSGAHLNPAVSIAMLSLRSISPLQCLTYVISQFIGAFIAAALVFVTYIDGIYRFDGGRRQVIGNRSTAGIFGTLPAQDVSQISLFFDQVLSTAVLLVAVCALSNKRNKLVANAQTPIAVGFVIVAIGVAFGYNCGFPINPARDLSPRIFSYFAGYGKEVFTVGNYYFWIPCIGPVFGGLIGTWVYRGYSKLMKMHIGESERDIVQARYQLDLQNISRI